MRFLLAFALAFAAFAQSSPPDPYVPLRARDYDAAIDAFVQTIQASPDKPNLRKDLAYTYLKIGEPVLARDQFAEAIRLDASDTTAALEYAFLCYETQKQAEARRVFDRLRKSAGSPARETAETAFHNIDDPLAAGITRWQAAIAAGADTFSTHFELAQLAEQRDETALAGTHYERAWRILPDRRTVLVDLGRVWKAAGRIDDANAALLAASRGGEPRAAEMARELLPSHYPYVDQFRRALSFDPANHELRRELAYLLLRLNREREAEAEFDIITQNAPNDLLSATQLGFLLWARGEKIAAQALFDRVLAGNDEELANRVRAVLRIPQVLKPRAEAPASIEAKVMAERSIKAGYMKDALKYLEAAHESDPGDFTIMLQLAWTNNILHRDVTALRWFDLARHSPDIKIASDASRGYRNLHSVGERFRVSAWFFPVFSTRWHDAFGYGQIKTELNTSSLIRPYVSTRLVGDSRFTNLSESSVIFAIGAATEPRHGVSGWFEAGSALNYRAVHFTPDYRGGIHVTRSLRFATTDLDALYVSRFDHNFLIYSQTRLGLRKLYWNFNLTTDAKRQDWANFVETGPGLRIPLPQSMYLTFNALRGRCLIDNPARRPTFNDLRAGLWYAFTR
jgi:tetratricopeptide (TPR) repeat protein